MDLSFMLNHGEPVSGVLTPSYINTQAQEYRRTCMLVADKARKARNSPTLAADLTSLTPSAATDSNVPVPREDFWSFGKLPPEIRLMIWVGIIFLI
jgi:hypothetical protein